MFYEETAACGKTKLEQVYPECLQPMGRIHTVAGEEYEEEGAAERSCYKLTKAHQSDIHVPLEDGNKINYFFPS